MATPYQKADDAERVATRLRIACSIGDFDRAAALAKELKVQAQAVRSACLARTRNVRLAAKHAFEAKLELARERWRAGEFLCVYCGKPCYPTRKTFDAQTGNGWHAVCERDAQEGAST